MAADDQIGEDCHCPSCGSNVRGLRPRDSCPECGRSVTEALNKLLWKRGEGLSTIPLSPGLLWLVRVGGVLLMLAGLVGVVYFYRTWNDRSTTPYPYSIILIAISALMLIVGLVMQRGRFLNFVARRSKTCSKCGYNLHKSTSPRCPECGAWFVPTPPPGGKDGAA